MSPIPASLVITRSSRRGLTKRAPIPLSYGKDVLTHRDFLTFTV